MPASLHEKAFSITGPLWGEYIDHHNNIIYKFKKCVLRLLFLNMLTVDVFHSVKYEKSVLSWKIDMRNDKHARANLVVRFQYVQKAIFWTRRIAEM